MYSLAYHIEKEVPLLGNPHTAICWYDLPESSLRICEWSFVIKNLTRSSPPWAEFVGTARIADSTPNSLKSIFFTHPHSAAIDKTQHLNWLILTDTVSAWSSRPREKCILHWITWACIMRNFLRPGCQNAKTRSKCFTYRPTIQSSTWMNIWIAIWRQVFTLASRHETGPNW